LYPGSVPLETAEAVAKYFFTQLPEAASANASEVIKALWPVSSDAPPDIWHLGPVVDGIAMTDHPIRLIEAGLFKRVPVLVGSNRDEMASIFCDPSICGLALEQPNLTEAEFDADVPRSLDFFLKSYTELNHTFPGIRNFDFEQVKERYDPSVHPEDYPIDLRNYSRWWWAHMRIQTDFYLGQCGVRHFANALSRHGATAFKYQFRHPTGDFASHGNELPYVFGIPDPPSEEEVALSKAVIASWVGFATLHTLPWEAHKTSTDVTMLFDVESSGGLRAVSHLRQQACEMWEGARRHQFSPPPIRAKTTGAESLHEAFKKMEKQLIL
jgi:carboxylesterase type B